MRVRAADGQKCPRENNPREYITDDVKGTEVSDTTYYRRLIDDGSLILLPLHQGEVQRSEERRVGKECRL